MISEPLFFMWSMEASSKTLAPLKSLLKKRLIFSSFSSGRSWLPSAACSSRLSELS
jgi:hypothetical protein